MRPSIWHWIVPVRSGETGSRMMKLLETRFRFSRYLGSLEP
jgi:hypothetical protein